MNVSKDKAVVGSNTGLQKQSSNNNSVLSEKVEKKFDFIKKNNNQPLKSANNATRNRPNKGFIVKK